VKQQVLSRAIKEGDCAVLLSPFGEIWLVIHGNCQGNPNQKELFSSLSLSQLTSNDGRQVQKLTMYDPKNNLLGMHEYSYCYTTQSNQDSYENCKVFLGFRMFLGCENLFIIINIFVLLTFFSEDSNQNYRYDKCTLGPLGAILNAMLVIRWLFIKNREREYFNQCSSLKEMTLQCLHSLKTGPQL